MQAEIVTGILILLAILEQGVLQTLHAPIYAPQAQLNAQELQAIKPVVITAADAQAGVQQFHAEQVMDAVEEHAVALVLFTKDNAKPILYLNGQNFAT